MSVIDLQLDGDSCWPDLKEKIREGLVTHAVLEGLALLPDGEVTDGVTGEIKRVPILTLRVLLPDGTIALPQVKVEMLDMIMAGVRGRLGYLADLKKAGGEVS
jgi:hypothetical protein